MVKFPFSNNDFKFFKRIPALLRIIVAFLFAIGGFMMQLFIPIAGVFPYTSTIFSPIPFFVGFFFLIVSIILIFPERLKIAEEPELVAGEGIWEETTMKQLSNVFNVINTRKKKEKSIAAFFDLTKAKGKISFLLTFIILSVTYLLLLFAVKRFFFAAIMFIFDIYIFVIPLWFVIRIEVWDPEIVRKILFYYQTSQHDYLNDIEYTASPAVQLKQIKSDLSNEEILLPVNVRFTLAFDEAPKSFESFSIQILLNQSMGNKFPFLVGFLRMRKPKEWMPLKKDEALADGIVKIRHMVEEDDLHVFVLSKSTQAENPKHTSPYDAAKIIRRAHKMMMDFA